MGFEHFGYTIRWSLPAAVRGDGCRWCRKRGHGDYWVDHTIVTGTAGIFFIRQFAPVFNVVSVGDEPFLHQQAARVLSAATCDDIFSLGDRVLLKAKPRMSAVSWMALVVGAASAGDRTMAARLARQARLCHPQLKKLRALPRLTLPCPTPNNIVLRLQGLMRAQMLALPHFNRSVHFFPTLHLCKDLLVAVTNGGRCSGSIGPNL